MSKQNTQNYYLEILNSIPDSLVIALDTSYKYIYFNDTHVFHMQQAYGTKPELHTSIFDYISKTEDIAKIRKNYDKAIQGENVVFIEEFGKIHSSYYEIHIQPFYDDQQKIAGISIFAIDITKNVEAEQLQQDIASKFKSIFEHADTAICLDKIEYDAQGKAVNYTILEVNPAFRRVLNMEEAEIQGNLATEVYKLEAAPFLDIYAAVAETGKAQTFEAYFPPADKNLSITASCPKKGYFSTMFTDITEQKQKDAEIRQRLEELLLFNTNAQISLKGGKIQDILSELYITTKAFIHAAAGFLSRKLDSDQTNQFIYTDLPNDSMNFPQTIPAQLEQIIETVHKRKTAVCYQDSTLPMLTERLPGNHLSIQSLLIVPLLVEQHCIGTLCFINTPGGFSEHAIAFIQNIGNLAAIAIKLSDKRKKLVESEQLYNSFINAHEDMIFVKDEDLKYTIVNSAFLNYLKIPKSEILGKTDADFMDSETAGICAQSDREALKGSGPKVTYEKNRDRYYEITKFPMQLEQGELKLGGILRDITEQKKLEEARILNEARLSSLVRILEHPVMSTQQFLDYALEEALLLTESKIGYIYFYSEERKEFILNTWSVEVMKECRVMKPESCYELDKTGLWGEAVRQRKPIIVNDYAAENPYKKGYPEGHVALFNYMTIPIFIDGTIVAVVGVANKNSDYDQTDVLQLRLLMESVWRETEHRKIQEELSRLEWMLSPQSFSQRSPISTLDHQNYGDLTELNDKGLIKRSIDTETLQNLASDYLDLLGTSSAIYEWDGSYAMGIFDSGWCRTMDEASRALCNTNSNKEALASGKWLCHESCWTDCSKKAIETGAPVDIVCHGGIHLHAVPIISDGAVIGAINFGYGDPPEEQKELIQISQKYHLDSEIVINAAKTYESRPPFIIEIAKKRLKDTARLIGLLVHEKQAEEQQHHLNAQLRQSQKMEAVGQLAGGVAHDFNNILQAIMGYAQILSIDSPPGSDLEKGLQEIYQCGERAASLTKQLLAFSRRQIMRPTNIDLNNIVEAIQNMLKRVIGEHITLKWFPGNHLGLIYADVSMMEQVLINLCVNARDAVEKGGIITIETQNVLIDTEYCSTHVWAKPGRYVLLSVSDNGKGMSQEVLDQIFEPFFTTKPEGRGTGLGLSTVYGIVNQHKGMIYAYSELGKGTTIKVYYPISERKAVEIGNSIRPAIHGGTETILVAEDDPGVRTLVQKVLEHAGYKVLLAKDGNEAVDAFIQHADALSLVLLDVVMPHLGGHKAHEKMEAIRPGIPVIFASGYSQNAVHTNFILHEGLKLLQKPYSTEELLKTIRETLDNNRTVNGNQ